MKTKTHIFFTTFFCMIIFLIKPEISLLNLSVIWFSGWLFPDLDHYIKYIFKNKKLNPIKFYKYSMQKLEKTNKNTKTTIQKKHNAPTLNRIHNNLSNNINILPNNNLHNNRPLISLNPRHNRLLQQKRKHLHKNLINLHNKNKQK